MQLDHAACYKALLARDRRYDGVFFTAVKTTGIYCRPICPARPPKPENCIFMPSAAAAQEAGFRPCLRCRPESSPDLGAWNGTSATVSRALKLIEAGALDRGNTGELAERLGIGDRQLRRLFQRHVGASPISVAQTRRVLLAKQLLQETDLAITQVALASGFASLRRFNETIRDLYGRPPSAMRRATVRTGIVSGKGLRLTLPYKPPYDWEAMLGGLLRHCIPGMKTVASGTYSRVITLNRHSGAIEVSDVPAASALSLVLDFPDLSELPNVIARVRRMFDLGADPIAIGHALTADPLLAPLIVARPGLRVPGSWDDFDRATSGLNGPSFDEARLQQSLSVLLGRPATSKDVTERMERWQPWCAYALQHVTIAEASVDKHEGKRHALVA